MSIDQTRTVDAIGIEKGSGAVVLTISDHLPWDEQPEHLLLLQEKLNTYLAFVEGGEIYSVYPDAKGRSLLIDLVCKHPPTAYGVEFLNKISPIVAQAGVLFRYRGL